jgi:hypothetical protein
MAIVVEMEAWDPSYYLYVPFSGLSESGFDEIGQLQEYKRGYLHNHRRGPSALNNIPILECDTESNWSVSRSQKDHVS